ncbi:Plant invertase/pectin methylesterase inhibitor superfamily protein [Hirschfeldia incana]|nr:Plant invertase/pectin methylesterase inhibitor superfamily protein [Hirschfeldia incana]
MKFLINIVMFFLLINIFTANAQSLIQNSCKKAAARDRKLRLHFCINSLEGHDRSKIAQSLGELATASMTNAGTRSRRLEAKADKILKEKNYGKDSVLGMLIKDCVRIYKDNYVTLKEAVTSVRVRDYKTAIFVMGSALNATRFCETRFETRDPPQISPFTRDNDILTQMIRIPLAFTKMLK